MQHYYMLFSIFFEGISFHENFKFWMLFPIKPNLQIICKDKRTYAFFISSQMIEHDIMLTK